MDAFYKDLFRLHSCEALVAIVKGLRSRMAERKTRSSRAEATMKRAKDMLHGELSVALDIDLQDVESLHTSSGWVSPAILCEKAAPSSMGRRFPFLRPAKRPLTRAGREHILFVLRIGIFGEDFGLASFFDGGIRT